MARYFGLGNLIVFFIFGGGLTPLFSSPFDDDQTFVLADVKSIAIREVSERTGQDIEDLVGILAISDRSLRDEAFATLGKLALKIQDYVASFGEENVGSDRTVSQKKALGWHRRACEEYWSTWKKFAAEKSFVPFSTLEKLEPPEDLSRRWMSEIRSNAPAIRQAILDLVAKKNLSAETRKIFSSIAVRLYTKDPFSPVRHAAVRALGRLQVGDDAAKSALLQALSCDEEKEEAIEAMKLWGKEAIELTPRLRAELEKSDFDTATSILRALRNIEGRVSNETLASAKEILAEALPAEDPRAISMLREAYVILRGHHALPEKLPPELLPISDWYTETRALLLASVERGDPRTALRLLREGVAPEDPKIADSLLNLGLEGNVPEIANILIDLEDPIRVAYFDTFRWAAIKKHHFLTDKFLTLRSACPSACLTQGLLGAIFSDDRELFEQILRAENFDRSAIPEAFVFGSNLGRTELLAKMLKLGPIRDGAIFSAATNSAKFGHLSTLQLFTEDIRSNSALMRSVLREASFNGRREIVDYLSHTFGPLKVWELEVGIIESAKEGHEEIFEFFFSQWPMESDILKRVLPLAAGRNGLAEHILKKGKFDDQTLQKTMLHAAEEGNFELVRTIWEMLGTVEDIILEQLFTEAIRWNDKPMIERLVGTSQLEAAGVSRAALVLLVEGNQDIVAKVMQLAPDIDADTVGAILIQATIDGEAELVEVVLKRKELNRERIYQALDLGAGSSSVPTVVKLLDRITLTEIEERKLREIAHKRAEWDNGELLRFFNRAQAQRSIR